MKSICFIVLFIFSFTFVHTEKKMTAKIAYWEVNSEGFIDWKSNVVVTSLIKICMNFDQIIIKNISSDNDETFNKVIEGMNELFDGEVEYFFTEYWGQLDEKIEFVHIYKDRNGFKSIDKIKHIHKNDFKNRMYYDPILTEYTIYENFAPIHIQTDIQLITVNLHNDLLPKELNNIVEYYLNDLDGLNEENLILLGNFQNLGSQLNEKFNEHESIVVFQDGKNFENQTSYLSMIYNSNTLDSSWKNFTTGVYNFKESLDLTLAQSKEISNFYPIYFEFEIPAIVDNVEKINENISVFEQFGSITINITDISGSLNLELYNFEGVLLKSNKEYLTGENNRVYFEVSNLRTGAYFLKISIGNESFVKKVIITN